jgi:hypothetical protein
MHIGTCYGYVHYPTARLSYIAECKDCRALEHTCRTVAFIVGTFDLRCWVFSHAEIFPARRAAEPHEINSMIPERSLLCVIAFYRLLMSLLRHRVFGGLRFEGRQPSSLRSSLQVGAIHPLYLYSEMSDTSLPTSRCGRRASALTSQES